MQAFKTVRAAVAQISGEPMLCSTGEPLPRVENSSARRLAALLPGFAFFCSLFCREGTGILVMLAHVRCQSRGLGWVALYEAYGIFIIYAMT